jgi:hypothetical protein
MTDPRDSGDAFFEADQVEVDPRSISATELDEGGSGVSDENPLIDSDDSLELLEDLDLRSDETTDPEIASDEGLAYVPPVDPPIVPSGDQGAVVAAGFGASALDEPYDADHHDSALAADDEMSDRVREAIRADASTTQYADSVEIDAEGGRVVLRGVVEDLEDDDNLVAVASTVTGVAEVVDRLDVATL